MRNIKLVIEYDGTDYNGWQAQKLKGKNAVTFRHGQRRQASTIQESIEGALQQILQEKVRIIGAGRTDAGVHAQGQTANFKTDSSRSLELIKKGLNAVLPEDIVIKDIREVDLDFHSRFDAKSKIYRYTILNRGYRAVFEQRYCYFIPYKLDFASMKREIFCLEGKKDFKTFQAADKKKRASVKTIRRIKFIKKGDIIILEFEAEGFLYKMIRNIVGTLIEIGRGKFKSGNLKKILESKNRQLAGPTAPARGLCLVKVNY